jgi:hypothetical protein
MLTTVENSQPASKFRFSKVIFCSVTNQNLFHPISNDVPCWMPIVAKETFGGIG